jgi:hypothetical protein
MKKSSVAAARYGLVRANAITTSTKNRIFRAWQVLTSSRRSRLGVGCEESDGKPSSKSGARKFVVP